jgi:hypothetical protein
MKSCIQTPVVLKKEKKITKLSSAKLTKKKREKIQINKTRYQKGDITNTNTEIQRIIRDYYKQLFVKKLENLENKTHKFLNTCILPKLSHKDIEDQANNK